MAKGDRLAGHTGTANYNNNSVLSQRRNMKGAQTVQLAMNGDCHSNSVMLELVFSPHCRGREDVPQASCQYSREAWAIFPCDMLLGDICILLHLRTVPGENVGVGEGWVWSHGPASFYRERVWSNVISMQLAANAHPNQYI